MLFRSGLVIDEGADSLDTSSSGESSDGGLGDAFNGSSGVSLLGGSLGSDLSLSSDSFSSFSCSSHNVSFNRNTTTQPKSNLNAPQSYFYLSKF